MLSLPVIDCLPMDLTNRIHQLPGVCMKIQWVQDSVDLRIKILPGISLWATAGHQWGLMRPRHWPSLAPLEPHLWASLILQDPICLCPIPLLNRLPMHWRLWIRLHVQGVLGGHWWSSLQMCPGSHVRCRWVLEASRTSWRGEWEDDAAFMGGILVGQCIEL